MDNAGRCVSDADVCVGPCFASGLLPVGGLKVQDAAEAFELEGVKFTE